MEYHQAHSTTERGSTRRIVPANEVGVTFSDSDSAPVLKFSKPGPDPAILKIENPTPVQTPAEMSTDQDWIGLDQD